MPRLINQISPIYKDSKIMQSIMSSQESEIERIEELVVDIQSQMFISTATWGLAFWEKELGIEGTSSLGIERRRANVLTKLRTRAPVNKDMITSTLEAFSGRTVDVEEVISQYALKVSLERRDVKTADLIGVLNRIKPAHLGYLLEVTNVKCLKERSGLSSRTRNKLSLSQYLEDLGFKKTFKRGTAIRIKQKTILSHAVDNSALESNLEAGSTGRTLNKITLMEV